MMHLLAFCYVAFALRDGHLHTDTHFRVAVGKTDTHRHTDTQSLEPPDSGLVVGEGIDESNAHMMDNVLGYLLFGGIPLGREEGAVAEGAGDAMTAIRAAGKD